MHNAIGLLGAFTQRLRQKCNTFIVFVDMKIVYLMAENRKVQKWAPEYKDLNIASTSMQNQ